MPRDVRVSLTLAGRHSLEPDGAKEACAALERAVSGSTAMYRIRCLGKEHSKGGEQATEAIVIDIDKVSYDVFWAARSSFRAPGALVDAVTRCLGASGDLNVRASATVELAPITLPTIGGGSLGEKVSSIMFALPPPGASQKDRGLGAASFDGVATPSGRDTASITFFGECAPGAANALQSIDSVLGALSGYCEANAK